MLAGEFLALTGAKLNGAEMMACGLATHYSVSEVSSIRPFCFFQFTYLSVMLTVCQFTFFLQKLPLIEEELGKLVTDDPSVIEACLEKYSDLVYPDMNSVIHRFFFFFSLSQYIYKSFHCKHIGISNFYHVSNSASLLYHLVRIDIVDKCFGLDTVEEIIDSLVYILFTSGLFLLRLDP